MRHRLLEVRRKDSGFTLIELLIVIVILAVLAGVVVLAVSAFDDRGEEAACKSDVKAVEVAVEAYRANNGAYPGSLQDLVDAGYLREAPNDDPNTGKYRVEYDGAGGVTGYLNGSETVCAGAPATGEPGGGEEPGGEEPGEEAPGAVAGLSVGGVTQNSATISWSAPTSGGAPTGYIVQWANNSGFSGASEVSVGGTSHVLSGLSASTTYYVRVAATNGVGQSTWAETSFTTSSPPQVAPSVPTGLRHSNCSGNNSNRTCTLAWNASSGTPTPTYQWEVVRRSGSGNCTFSSGSTGYQSGTATGTSVQVSNLNRNSNGTYCFRVRATNAAGTSNWSSTYQFQP